MIRKLLYAFLMAALALILIPVSASANSYDTAETLTFTGEWSGFQYIASESETWYLVDIPSDGAFEFRVMNYTDKDIGIHLMSADLSATHYEEYTYGGTETSPNTKVYDFVLSKGKYYLKLTNYGWGDEAIKYKMKNTFTS